MTATTRGLATTSSVDDNTSETLARRLRAHLQAVARQRVPITYHEAAKELRLTPPNTIHQVALALERLMAEDAAANRPFIAAMVISKARGGLPAPGFFDFARRLGRFAGDSSGAGAWDFHAREFNAAAGFWAASGISGEKCSNDRQDARQAGASISEQET